MGVGDMIEDDRKHPDIAGIDNLFKNIKSVPMHMGLG